MLKGFFAGIFTTVGIICGAVFISSCIQEIEVKKAVKKERKQEWEDKFKTPCQVKKVLSAIDIVFEIDGKSILYRAQTNSGYEFPNIGEYWHLEPVTINEENVCVTVKLIKKAH